jgi:hypothetical protein
MTALDNALHLRSSDLRNVSSHLVELSTARDAVWRSMTRGIRGKDSGRERPPEERLRDFLHKRTSGPVMQRERESADRFLNELERINAVLTQSGPPRERLEVLQTDGVLLFATINLRQCLGHLSTIEKARAEDTFSSVRSAVRKRALEDLHATFADVVQAFPHSDPSNSHLSVWRGGSR